jgi:hypothetical protein
MSPRPPSIARLRRVHRCLAPALAVLLLLGAGADAALEVTAPPPSAVLTWMPLDLSLEFDAEANAQTLSVELNAADVTALFVLDPPQGGRRTARASDVWGSFVLPGPNLLRAAIEVGGVPQQASAGFNLVGDPYADEVASYVPGSQGGFNGGDLAVALGAPQGEGLFQGSLDVVSLGFGGEIVLRFADNLIVDGPGADFTVFENAFLEIGAGGITDPPFAEPGRVSASQDGQTWLPFSACPIDDPDAGPYWPGCAGVYPVLSDGTSATPHASIPTTTPIQDLVGVHFLSLQTPEGAGGDSFDLATVGLAWARYVRVEAASFATGPTGANNGGFDLDAVTAIHSAPALAAPVPALSGPARLVAAALLAAVALLALRRGSHRGGGRGGLASRLTAAALLALWRRGAS